MVEITSNRAVQEIFSAPGKDKYEEIRKADRCDLMGRREDMIRGWIAINISGLSG